MLDKQSGMQYIPCSTLRPSFVSIVLSFAPVPTHVACHFCMIYGTKHTQHFKVLSVNEQGPTLKPPRSPQLGLWDYLALAPNLF